MCPYLAFHRATETFVLDGESKYEAELHISMPRGIIFESASAIPSGPDFSAMSEGEHALQPHGFRNVLRCQRHE